ncbi:MAG: alanine racemase [Deltaproteobacteria bacterium]|jgi:alanine racemase|nr:alanine racemase [Deltaproteobacteria bacterium]MBT4267439.1 alanine racemase [Deltaproteobacteria bacterium]MBT4640863.1 alanine racemase [Deltaproteobacteria bacterium]MBT6502384.1 alanine racemase [Deltaproteobacteria bacterium]MBT6612212.1 alanine racemase [Deltaproteobacteria bacterium]
MPFPQESRLAKVRRLRPSWIEISPEVIAHNVARLRRLIGVSAKIMFTCKGDGYGFGVVKAARLAIEAGVDGLCIGSPEEAILLREAGIEVPILMFACTLPQAAEDVIDLDVTVTIHSLDSLNAYIETKLPVKAFVEIDCGMGRFGLIGKDWKQAFEKLFSASNIELMGVYTHLSSPEDETISRNQLSVYDQAVQCARDCGFMDFETMVASSRVVIEYPDLTYSAVDPGRFIFGALDESYKEKAGLKSMLHAVRGRLIQVQPHAAGTELGIGYGKPIKIDKPMRVGLVPIGFVDGLNHAPPLGYVLIEGQRAPILGRRTLMHTIVDITDIEEAKIGSEVTLLGRQGNDEITMEELADMVGLPSLELFFRITRSLSHITI